MNATHGRSPVSDLRGCVPDRLGSVGEAPRRKTNERNAGGRKYQRKKVEQTAACLSTIDAVSVVLGEASFRGLRPARVCVTGRWVGRDESSIATFRSTR